MVFKTNYRLMQVKSIAECSKGSILQYFWPSLSYHLSLRSLFCLFWVAVLHRFYCTKNTFAHLDQWAMDIRIISFKGYWQWDQLVLSKIWTISLYKLWHHWTLGTSGSSNLSEWRRKVCPHQTQVMLLWDGPAQCWSPVKYQRTR